MLVLVKVNALRYLFQKRIRRYFNVPLTLKLTNKNWKPNASIKWKSTNNNITKPGHLDMKQFQTKPQFKHHLIRLYSVSSWFCAIRAKVIAFLMENFVFELINVNELAQLTR